MRLGQSQQRRLIQLLFEDRGHAGIVGCGDGQGMRAALLQECLAVALAELQQPQAATLAMLRMRAVLQLPLGHLQGGEASVLEPVQETSQRPVTVGSVALGHVLGQGREAPQGITQMRRHPLLLVEHFHHGVSQAHLQHFACQAVGHSVQAPVEVEMVVDAGFGLTPFRIVVEHFRQRPAWAVDGREQVAPALLAPPGRAGD